MNPTALRFSGYYTIEGRREDLITVMEGLRASKKLVAASPEPLSLANPNGNAGGFGFGFGDEDGGDVVHDVAFPERQQVQVFTGKTAERYFTLNAQANINSMWTDETRPYVEALQQFTANQTGNSFSAEEVQTALDEGRFDVVRGRMLNEQA